jgi:hypothetical protein
VSTRSTILLHLYNWGASKQATQAAMTSLFAHWRPSLHAVHRAHVYCELLAYLDIDSGITATAHLLSMLRLLRMPVAQRRIASSWAQWVPSTSRVMSF